MKAEIKASGVMVVQSESELEAYALRKWCEDLNKKIGLGVELPIIFKNTFDSAGAGSDDR